MKKKILFFNVKHSQLILFWQVSFYFMTFDPNNWGLIGRIAFVFIFMLLFVYGLKNIDG